MRMMCAYANYFLTHANYGLLVVSDIMDGCCMSRSRHITNVPSCVRSLRTLSWRVHEQASSVKAEGDVSACIVDLSPEVWGFHDV
jgi:hypothetical protein